MKTGAEVNDTPVLGKEHVLTDDENIDDRPAPDPQAVVSPFVGPPGAL